MSNSDRAVAVALYATEAASLLSNTLGELRAAAQALLAQIEAGTFRDELGHDLKRNVHYIALRDLLNQVPAPPAPAGAAKPQG